MLGLTGLPEQPRTGRPPTYPLAEVGAVAVIAVSLTAPRSLGLPCARWTLDRLTISLHERLPEAGGPVPVRRGPIDRILSAEGLRWRKQETWFGERVGSLPRSPKKGGARNPPHRATRGE